MKKTTSFETGQSGIRKAPVLIWMMIVGILAAPVASSQAAPVVVTSELCCLIELQEITGLNLVEDGDEIYFVVDGIERRPAADPDYWRFDNLLTEKFVPGTQPLFSQSKGKISISLREQSSFHRNLGEIELEVDGGKIVGVSNKSPAHSGAAFDRTSGVVTFFGALDGHDWEYTVKLKVKEGVEAFAYCVTLKDVRFVDVVEPLTMDEAAFDGDPRDELFIRSFRVDPADVSNVLVSRPQLPNHDDYYGIAHKRKPGDGFKNKNGDDQGLPLLGSGALPVPAEGASVEHVYRVAFIEQDAPVMVPHFINSDDLIGVIRVVVQLTRKEGKLYYEAKWTEETDAKVNSSDANAAEIYLSGSGADYTVDLYSGHSFGGICD